jgi:hypothetical protein
MQKIKAVSEAPCILWCAAPEKLGARKPAALVTAADVDTFRRYLGLHVDAAPALDGAAMAPTFTFAPGPRMPAHTFQAPGEGPFQLAPAGPYALRLDDRGDVVQRIDNVVAQAHALGVWMRRASLLGVPAVWCVGAEADDGASAVGMALALRRVVAISAAPPSLLVTTIARKHGVELRVVVDVADNAAAAEVLQ